MENLDHGKRGKQLGCRKKIRKPHSIISSTDFMKSARNRVLKQAFSKDEAFYEDRKCA